MGLRTFLARFVHNRVKRRIARRLDLDSAQASRLEAIHEALHALRDEARAGWSYQRQAVLGLFDQERLDRDAALRLARVPMALVDDELPRAVDRVAEFYDSLTAEQRARLRDMIGEHGRRHGLCSC